MLPKEKIRMFWLYVLSNFFMIWQLISFTSPLCWWIDKKEERILCLYMHVLSHVHVYAYTFVFTLCTSLTIFIVYCYAWVKGEFLWSLTLIYAYITPWVLSSSKKGRSLAQRPITLVLMIINSCSYSLLMILCLFIFSYLSRS